MDYLTFKGGGVGRFGQCENLNDILSLTCKQGRYFFFQLNSGE